MKSSVPGLLPILRSDTTGELLARLLLQPSRWWSLAELSDATGASMPTITREVTRVVQAGIADERRVGRARLVRAAEASPLVPALSELITLTYGPVPLLEAALARVPGVRSAFVYGSWAQRRAGRAGPPPRDIDVISTGPADVDDVYDAARSVEAVLGREVNIRHFEGDDWPDQAQQTFVEHVLAQPRVVLDLHRGQHVAEGQ